MQTWEMQAKIEYAKDQIVEIVDGKVSQSDIREIKAILDNLKELLNRA